MKKIFIILIMLLCSTAFAQLKTGNLADGDTLISFVFQQPVNMLTLMFVQNDTNGTAAGGYPDSIHIWVQMGAAVDTIAFRQSAGDSNFTTIVLSKGKKRTGWAYLPNVMTAVIELFNKKYLTNRDVDVYAIPKY